MIQCANARHVPVRTDYASIKEYIVATFANTAVGPCAEAHYLNLRMLINQVGQYDPELAIIMAESLDGHQMAKFTNATQGDYYGNDAASRAQRQA